MTLCEEVLRRRPPILFGLSYNKKLKKLLLKLYIFGHNFSPNQITSILWRPRYCSIEDQIIIASHLLYFVFTG